MQKWRETNYLNCHECGSSNNGYIEQAKEKKYNEKKIVHRRKSARLPFGNDKITMKK